MMSKGFHLLGIDEMVDYTESVHRKLHMPTKTVETVNGSFVTYTRDKLERGSREFLREYLKSRGHALFASALTAKLREDALEDFDGA